MSFINPTKEEPKKQPFHSREWLANEVARLRTENERLKGERHELKQTLTYSEMHRMALDGTIKESDLVNSVKRWEEEAERLQAHTEDQATELAELYEASGEKDRTIERLTRERDEARAELDTVLPDIHKSYDERLCAWRQRAERAEQALRWIPVEDASFDTVYEGRYDSVEEGDYNLIRVAVRREIGGSVWYSRFGEEQYDNPVRCPDAIRPLPPTQQPDAQGVQTVVERTVPETGEVIVELQDAQNKEIPPPAPPPDRIIREDMPRPLNSQRGEQQPTYHMSQSETEALERAGRRSVTFIGEQDGGGE